MRSVRDVSYRNRRIPPDTAATAEKLQSGDEFGAEHVGGGAARSRAMRGNHARRA